jgi:hypothetical protein
MKRLGKEQRQAIAALAAMDDADIALTGTPEVPDWSGNRALLPAEETASDHEVGRGPGRLVEGLRAGLPDQGQSPFEARDAECQGPASQEMTLTAARRRQ